MTMPRDTNYATLLAEAEIDFRHQGNTADTARVERLWVKHKEHEEIRFSWWRYGVMMPRPLDLPEEDWLRLLEAGVRQGVLSTWFVEGIKKLLISQ